MNRSLTLLLPLLLLFGACGDATTGTDLGEEAIPLNPDTGFGDTGGSDSGGLYTDTGLGTYVDAGRDTSPDSGGDTSADTGTSEDAGADTGPDVPPSDSEPDTSPDVPEDTESDSGPDTEDADTFPDVPDDPDTDTSEEDVEPDTPEIVCSAGETSCFDSGDSFYVCNEAGTDLEVVFCDSDEFCSDGGCIPNVCEAGEVACDGDTPLVCAPTGRTWVEAGSCGSDSVCETGECVPLVCTPGDVPTCIPNPETTYFERHRYNPLLGYAEPLPGGDPSSDPLICNPTGTGYNLWDTCGSEEICYEGRCEPYECWPLTSRCVPTHDGVFIQTCGRDGQWEDPDPCSLNEDWNYTWELGDPAPEGASATYEAGDGICLTFTIPERGTEDIVSLSYDWEGQRSAHCYIPDHQWFTSFVRDRDYLLEYLPFPHLWPSLGEFPAAGWAESMEGSVLP